MIKFSELPEKHNITETHSPVEYKEIKAGRSLSKEQATNFWDNVFSIDSEKQDNNNHDKESMISEIFDVDEDEIVLDFEIDEELKAVLGKFKITNWERLSETDREILVSELISIISDKLGMDETPSLQFFEDSINKCGTFVWGDNTIEINKNIFSDPKKVVNTVSHEVRHAYQYERAQKQETYTDKLYKLNFENYISPVMLPDGKYLFFTDYQDQYIEVEARAFEKLFSEEGAK